jgi:hypothetical protein
MSWQVLWRLISLAKVVFAVSVQLFGVWGVWLLNELLDEQENLCLKGLCIIMVGLGISIGPGAVGSMALSVR